ncbi:MAG TPA: LLM class flavin-dependent oxidoreductase [Kofleriaceae bacterium]|nr:LLM class flavin-dependent oxidoreductase [Kofleriaceae bacterium]
MKFPLSVLDLSPVGPGVPPSRAIRESVEMAMLADKLGYTRYWFAEHHGMRTLSASAPEVLIANVAGRTSQIKVGAGGIMIPNHAPLHVVEVFRTLEALHPGRIDLGLGRTTGADRATASALRRNDETEVNELFEELMAFEDGGFSIHHPYAKVIPMPADVSCASIWMLGGSVGGAGNSARLGMPYAFAGHFGLRNARDAIAEYRKSFQPSRRLAAPYALCSISVICGADDEDAHRLAGPMRVSIANSRAGKREPVLSVEEAAKRTFTPEEQANIDAGLADIVIGGPARVCDRLLTIARDIGADELMISPLAPTHETRRASLEHIASAM